MARSKIRSGVGFHLGHLSVRARMLNTVRRTASVAFWLSMLCALGACSEHVVDTFPEWCEQIAGVDLEKKYAPSWAVLFSVRVDGDAIRDDYVKFLNDSHREKVQNRMPRMAWREGAELHLVNLSSLLMVEPEVVIREWRKGVETANRYEHESSADACLYGTLSSMFDSLHIHSMESDSLGRNWTDEVTVILTERKDRLGDKAL
jgi:hypothetical protein